MKKQKRSYQFHGAGMKEATAKYHAQKSSAKQRGIEWLFTFEVWIKWWEEQLGPNWLELRGCKADQYQMARFNDEGPYTPENVYCATPKHQGVDRMRNGHVGTGRPLKVDPKAIEDLFLQGKCPADIARELKIERGAIGYHFPDGLRGIMKEHNIKQMGYWRRGFFITITI